MRTIKPLIILAAALLLAASCNRDNTIRTKVPARPAGQTDVIALAAPAIDTVRIGFIGLGMRGNGAIDRFIHMPGARIAALCDIVPERVEANCAKVVAAGFEAPACYSGDEECWKQLCERDDIDLVYVCTDWKKHAMMGVYAMEHGKHVAIEVPAAMNLEEIWALINTSEKTRRHCMQLENCCYDFFELTALAMAQAGVIGEVIHAEGAYLHNLDEYWDEYYGNWRLDYNASNKGDFYPTHGLCPVCQALNIHRGDRLTTLVSMGTDAFNGPKILAAKGQEDTTFADSDQTTTMIRTAKGKTILIEHDVMTPRPYNRMYQLVGTDGYLGKYPVPQGCIRSESHLLQGYDDLGGELVLEGAELDALMSKYPNPILNEDLERVAKEVGGHGGMDFIMDYRLVYCLRNGLPLDMDVYDLAESCCLCELTGISIENGNAPVEVPDFTRGGWDKTKGFNYSFK